MKFELSDKTSKFAKRTLADFSERMIVMLEEALKLFAQSGYMGTSMNDIASKLGVTRAALYKHYKSK